jgi:uncharacterized protein YndB with AHSA1/START domain
MNDSRQYTPGPAAGAHVQKDGERWTLVVARELRHPPEKVWRAITDPEHLREWAPFDADRNMNATGPVTLTTAGLPAPQVCETTITKAEAPTLLEYTWGGNELRWQLEPSGSGTRLTLWHNINRRYIAWGAAGWHTCFDVLDQLLSGQPAGRMVGPDVMKFEGWQRLTKEYAQQFGTEAPALSGGGSNS